MFIEPPITSAQMRKLWMVEWKFCECGRPWQVGEVLHAFLRAVDAPCNLTAEGMEDKHKRLCAVVPQEGPGVLWYYWTDRVGLTEHNGNVFGPWITNFGLVYLDGLNRHGSDPEKWEVA